MLFKRLGIDLGTANSLVYLAGEGVVLNEPTVVAVAIEDNRVVAVGNEAKEMLGRTPGNIVAMRPMKEGVIADYVVTEAMLRYFIDRVCGKTRFFKPEVMICVPAGCTQVERRAVMDATLSAGAKNVYLIEEPLAAAIGAKIPIALPSGNMIVDIGGGSSEAAVISLGGVVVHNSVRVAGTKLDEAITTYVKKKYNLIIGERMAEEIKIQIGSAIAPSVLGKQSGENANLKIEVRGRDSISGLPRMIELTSEEVAHALSACLNSIIVGIKAVLENTPPELASDIIDKGIMLSGGTALLRNIDKLIMNATGVPVHIAEDPLLCVVRGTGVALENLELYKRSIVRR
jgi:rod shape-determining protein MreB